MVAWCARSMNDSGLGRIVHEILKACFEKVPITLMDK